MKLNEKQLQQVDAQVKRLLKSGSFYGEVYRKAGISGVSSQEDFEKLPFSSKDDLTELRFTIDNPMLSKDKKEALLITALGKEPTELSKDRKSVV